LRHGEKLPTLGDRMAIWLLRVFKGQDAASTRLEQLTTPQKMRAVGIGAVATGIILVAASLLQLMGLILLYFS
jgi:hypothetical protein